MENQRKCLRIGAAAIGCAILLRLLALSGISFGQNTSQLVSAMVFFSTGRLVRLTQDQTPVSQPVRDTVSSNSLSLQTATPAVFTETDASFVEVRNTSGCQIHIPTLLTQPLSWDLTQDEPTVLILHTHGSESYTKTEDYTESTLYRTLNQDYNMVSIGAHLASRLEQNGISVLHDTTLHDQPSYNGSYAHARTAIAQYLEQYPSIRLVLDLHRDAAQDASGNQIGNTVTIAEGEAAQLMLVMGTDAGGQTHPQWQTNLALACKLHATLEQLCPGICRPLQLRTSRFNQDLSPGALLIEVGAAGNTRQEALLAADLLAQSIVSLAYGT